MAVEYNESEVNILFNPTPFHSAPTALLQSDQALLQHFVNTSYTFAGANQPLPLSANAKVLSQANSLFNADSFSYSANMMFGFSFLAASFVFFLITERER